MFEAVKVYDSFDRAGVTWISTAGLVSILAIIILLVAGKLKNAYPRTHVMAYFISLLIANTIQSTGTAMNLRWVKEGEINAGMFCSLQGGIKQAGNVATAVWSFMIALHLFNLLFLRLPTTKLGLAATLCFGWAFVATIVSVGPVMIQTPEKGPYFGISGNWCWITNGYPKAQTFLEYFFEFFSAGVGFILYAAILMRVRGNLYQADDKWRLRFVPAGEGWKLSLGRDLLDSAMLKAAQHMVWYPVAYTVILVPISLARLVEFAGGSVPDWAVDVTDVLYNLTGFVNVMIFLATRHLFPDVGMLPDFTTPRKDLRGSFIEHGGVSPFRLSVPAVTLTTENGKVETMGDDLELGRLNQELGGNANGRNKHSSRRFSVLTSTTESGEQLPLRLPERVLTLFSKR